jgi:hypothetical protein
MDLDTNLKRLHALIFNEAKIGAQWKTFQARFLELLRTNKEVDFSKLEYRRKLLSEGLQDRQILAMRFIEDAERIALDTRKVLEDANKRRKDRSVSSLGIRSPSV